MSCNLAKSRETYWTGYTWYCHSNQSSTESIPSEVPPSRKQVQQKPKHMETIQGHESKDCVSAANQPNTSIHLAMPMNDKTRDGRCLTIQSPSARNNISFRNTFQAYLADIAPHMGKKLGHCKLRLPKRWEISVSAPTKYFWKRLAQPSVRWRSKEKILCQEEPLYSFWLGRLQIFRYTYTDRVGQTRTIHYSLPRLCLLPWWSAPGVDQ